MTTTDDPRLLFALLIWKNKQTNIKQQQQVEAGIQVTRQRLQFLLSSLHAVIRNPASFHLYIYQSQGLGVLCGMSSISS
ncbi:uncharacterized protein [Macaca nemestrina]|uniref:uncharacterized protein isoform X7 n=1 Tax=Macaca nemestrina TaxID=9545 RepID=UPI0039B87626